MLGCRAPAGQVGKSVPDLETGTFSSAMDFGGARLGSLHVETRLKDASFSVCSTPGNQGVARAQQLPR